MSLTKKSQPDVQNKDPNSMWQVVDDGFGSSQGISNIDYNVMSDSNMKQDNSQTQFQNMQKMDKREFA